MEEQGRLPLIHTKILRLNSIHSSVYIGMRLHLYIFFTMFCVHSFFVFVFLFIMLIWCPTVVSQHLSKNDKRGWLTRWPPQSFANPIWHSGPLCLHWSAIVPLCFHLLKCSLIVGLLLQWLLWCFCLLAESYETINHYHYQLTSWVKQQGLYSAKPASKLNCSRFF